VAVRAGAGTGSSTRITVTWPDGAIRNQWLQVTVNPTTFTALTAPDVYLFGNLVGDSGGTWGVDARDVTDTRRALGGEAAVTSPFDFNRDRRIDARDYALARSALGRSLAPPAVAVTRAIAAGTWITRSLTPAKRRTLGAEEFDVRSILQ
jgi:hypothetical protein